MEIKKNPKSNLENYSKLFMQLGLVLALFVTYVAIEKKTFDRQFGDLGDVNMNADMEEEIEVVEDEKEVEETVIESTETDESEAVEVEEIEEVEEAEEVIEDVPFTIIEDVPVFPGCKGNKKELKSCFNKKMQKHFQRKFNADLPNDLGLAPGKKRIIMLFKIDRQGDIVGIIAKAPHPKLQKEAIRIIKLLPKMKPGRQRGKAVGVKYTLPMRIDVE
jgi:protein TonB